MAHHTPAQLGAFLEALYGTYHQPRFLSADPLALVHRFHSSADREAAALFAALLAYGSVPQILRDLERLFDCMNGEPALFLREFDTRKAMTRLRSFKHRFTGGDDLVALCALLHSATRRKPLERAFAEFIQSEDEDLAPALDRFVAWLHALPLPKPLARQELLAKPSFKHLLPRPSGGSACKRWFLFLRWVVRPADGIDLGLWRSVPVNKLIVPLDRHVKRISENLGLSSYASASLNAAREITVALRTVRPDDPIRYDFALCHLGILQECPTRPSLLACKACELRPVCRRWCRMELEL